MSGRSATRSDDVLPLAGKTARFSTSLYFRH